MTRPTLIYHADWGSKAPKRWCAKATLGVDGRYTASGPAPVGDLTMLLRNLRVEAGEVGTVFAGFDFPIGLPANYASRAGVSRFSDFLRISGSGVWKDWYAVCDESEQISIHRPFFPNGAYKGRRKLDLFLGHGVTSLEPLLRRCELGGNGQKQACCLFWTLGGNQVGKATIIGWRDVLAPALQGRASVRLWPFEGSLETLFEPGNTVVAETYPAECYGWFPGDRIRSKADIKSRKDFGSRLLLWARDSDVGLEPFLETSIKTGFPSGGDDAFDAVVGLFGMLQIALGQRTTGEPEDEAIREVEGWILGRQ